MPHEHSSPVLEKPAEDALPADEILDEERPAESGPETDDEAPKEPETETVPYEQPLIEKLEENPELGNMANFRDTVSYGVKNAVHGIEQVMNAKQNVKDFVRGKYLRGRYNRAQRKQDRFERKAGLNGPEGASMFAYRREKFARKARVHKKIFLGRKQKQYDKHLLDVKARKEGIAEGKETRDAAYEAKREKLLQKSWAAQLRKFERRRNWLGKMEGRKSVQANADMLEDIRMRRGMLEDYLKELMKRPEEKTDDEKPENKAA